MTRHKKVREGSLLAANRYVVTGLTLGAALGVGTVEASSASARIIPGPVKEVGKEVATQLCTEYCGSIAGNLLGSELPSHKWSNDSYKNWKEEAYGEFGRRVAQVPANAPDAKQRKLQIANSIYNKYAKYWRVLDAVSLYESTTAYKGESGKVKTHKGDVDIGTADRDRLGYGFEDFAQNRRDAKSSLKSIQNGLLERIGLPSVDNRAFWTPADSLTGTSSGRTQWEWVPTTRGGLFWGLAGNVEGGYKVSRFINSPDDAKAFLKEFQIGRLFANKPRSKEAAWTVKNLAAGYGNDLRRLIDLPNDSFRDPNPGPPSHVATTPPSLSGVGNLREMEAAAKEHGFIDLREADDVAAHFGLSDFKHARELARHPDSDSSSFGYFPTDTDGRSDYLSGLSKGIQIDRNDLARHGAPLRAGQGASQNGQADDLSTNRVARDAPLEGDDEETLSVPGQQAAHVDGTTPLRKKRDLTEGNENRGQLSLTDQEMPHSSERSPGPGDAGVQASQSDPGQQAPSTRDAVAQGDPDLVYHKDAEGRWQPGEGPDNGAQRMTYHWNAEKSDYEVVSARAGQAPGDVHGAKATADSDNGSGLQPVTSGKQELAADPGDAADGGPSAGGKTSSPDEQLAVDGKEQTPTESTGSVPPAAAEAGTGSNTVSSSPLNQNPFASQDHSGGTKSEPAPAGWEVQSGQQQDAGLVGPAHGAARTAASVAGNATDGMNGLATESGTTGGSTQDGESADGATGGDAGTTGASGLGSAAVDNSGAASAGGTVSTPAVSDQSVQQNATADQLAQDKASVAAVGQQTPSMAVTDQQDAVPQGANSSDSGWQPGAQTNWASLFGQGGGTGESASAAFTQQTVQGLPQMGTQEAA
ncbi:hypothetical protein AB0N62_42930 [Streptomyces sp. NPDC093982]|uniref:hypothetical protein n=1 Tax=Streptomyces sp. NPDC093982 TaxID=3155077 RepID=UPI0034381ABF